MPITTSPDEYNELYSEKPVDALRRAVEHVLEQNNPPAEPEIVQAIIDVLKESEN